MNTISYELDDKIEERNNLPDFSEKSGLNGSQFIEGKDYINKEISTGNLRLFMHDGEPYIEVKAGYDKEGELKPFSVAKGKVKDLGGDEIEDLEEQTAPSETYEELGANTFIERERDDLIQITRGGTKIVDESGLIEFEDNNTYIKDKGEESEYIEYSKKTTNINVQQTILSKKRREGLLSEEGIEMTDKANGKKRIVKAIPLKDYKTYIDPKQHSWAEKILDYYNERVEENDGISKLTEATEKHIKKILERNERVKMIKIKNAKKYFIENNFDNYGGENNSINSYNLPEILKHINILLICINDEDFKEKANNFIFTIKLIINTEKEIENSVNTEVTDDNKKNIIRQFNLVKEKLDGLESKNNNDFLDGFGTD